MITHSSYWPFVRDTASEMVAAWINGVPMDVRKYQYPAIVSVLFLMRILIGSAAIGGENRLVIHFSKSRSASTLARPGRSIVKNTDLGLTEK